MKVKIPYLENLRDKLYSFNIGYGETYYSVIWPREKNCIYVMKGYYPFNLDFYNSPPLNGEFRYFVIDEDIKLSLDFILYLHDDMCDYFLEFLKENLAEIKE